ncbi:MAG: hypothetical protein WC436_05770 [Candidatus Babeliales bacterium]
MKSFLKINCYLFLFAILISTKLFAQAKQMIIQSETGKYIAADPAGPKCIFKDDPAEALVFEFKPLSTEYKTDDAVRFNTPLSIMVAGSDKHLMAGAFWFTECYPLKDIGEKIRIQWVIENEDWANKDLVKRNQLVRIETVLVRDEKAKIHGYDLCAKGNYLMHTQDFRQNRNRTDIPDQKIFWRIIKKDEAVKKYSEEAKKRQGEQQQVQIEAIKKNISGAVAQNQFEYILGEIGKMPIPPQDVKDQFYAKVKEKMPNCSISFLTKVRDDAKLGLDAGKKAELTKIINERKDVIEKEGISYAENIAIKSKDGKYLKSGPKNLLALATQVDDNVKFEISSLDKKKIL